MGLKCSGISASDDIYSNPQTRTLHPALEYQEYIQSGPAAQIAREKDQYKLDLLGISECRWTGAGRQKLATIQTMLYIGDEELHEGGVAIIVSKQAEKALTEWTAVSSRIISAQILFSIQEIESNPGVCPTQ